MKSNTTSNLCLFTSQRYVLTALVCTGLFILTASGINLPSSFVYTESEWPFKNHMVSGNLSWTLNSKKWCYQSYLIIYAISTVVGGLLTTLIPANILYGIAVGGAAALQFCMPISITSEATLAIFLNFLKGLLEGFAFPAVVCLLRFWVPQYEDTTLIAIAVFGYSMGEAINNETVKLLTVDWDFCNNIFYVFGSAGLIWLFLWLLLSHGHPLNNHLISERELAYIQSGTANEDTRYVYNINFSMANVVSTLLPMAAMVPVIGWIADYFRRKDLVSTTVVRKLMIGGGLLTISFLLPVVAFFTVEITDLQYMYFAIIWNVNATVLTGLMANILDMASKMAGILVGIIFGFGAAGSLIFTFVLNSILETEERLVTDVDKLIPNLNGLFIFTISINCLGGLFYIFFASSEKQDWPREQVNEACDSFRSSDDDVNGHAREFTVLRSSEDYTDTIYDKLVP
ncbi:hypothetical protein CHUAL_005250 [Chamberlinius hualienensis]